MLLTKALNVDMILTQENLSRIITGSIIKPKPQTFSLPVKVLQFGTGVLLRGLPDYFIHQANQAGIFNGRIAVVKSTPGDAGDFQQQDNLYTLCIRGLENGHMVEQNIISSAISHVLPVTQQWEAVLAIARSAELQLLISNTTEIGITLQHERIRHVAPASFPAKVLAVLYERYKAFNGTKDSGLVIIATELIPDNGKKLESIVQELAWYNELEAAFMEWLSTANHFCNSLVDRIVPGKPDAATLDTMRHDMGYTDNLLIIAEPYRLWAIEGNARVRAVLGFAAVDRGVIIAEDIEVYRELKVRLLNGTHTLSAALAFLQGIRTVKEAMEHSGMRHYMETLMQQEISPAIPYPVSERQTRDFLASVTDRFANPYIEHLWYNITFQYTMKVKIRVLPLLFTYDERQQSVPLFMARGIAAYLRFMQIDKVVDGKYYGAYEGGSYLIQDDEAEFFVNKHTVRELLEDSAFWGVDFSRLNGFLDAVEMYYAHYQVTI